MTGAVVLEIDRLPDPDRNMPRLRYVRYRTEWSNAPRRA